MSDSLLSLLKQDDHEAFAIIYNHYWRSLLNYAHKRLANPEDAEEVVQEVFIRLWERRSEIEISTSLAAYLHSAIKYKIYNRYRYFLSRKEAHKISGLTDVADAIQPIDALEFRELENSVRNAINALPSKCREVFVLSRNERLPNKTIAQRLGISVNTVEKHIGKALQLLRFRLSKELIVLLFSSAVCGL